MDLYFRIRMLMLVIVALTAITFAHKSDHTDLCMVIIMMGFYIHLALFKD